MCSLLNDSCIKDNENYRLRDIFNSISDGDRKTLSVEIRSNREVNKNILKRICPTFCSVTCHSTAGNVEEVPALRMAKKLCEAGFNVILHLPGTSLCYQLAFDILLQAKAIGIRNILALQGDIKSPNPNFLEDRDFPHAIHLVKFIRQHFGNYFSIGVAGYPQTHPASKSVEEDLFYLREKVMAGADFIMTQAVFDFDVFKEFMSKCENYGITVPIIPGVYSFNSYHELVTMSNFCQVTVPNSILKIVEQHKDNERIVRNYSTFHLTELVRDLFSLKTLLGVQIFSLNNMEIVEKVVKNLNYRHFYLEKPLKSRNKSVLT